jgi:hypothetical protein
MILIVDLTAEICKFFIWNFALHYKGGFGDCPLISTLRRILEFILKLSELRDKNNCIRDSFLLNRNEIDILSLTRIFVEKQEAKGIQFFRKKPLIKVDFRFKIIWNEHKDTNYFPD